MKQRQPTAGNQLPLTHSVIDEIRAPLHSISGFARLMLDEDVTDKNTRQEFLSIVVQQSENLARMLDELSGKLKPVDDTPAEDEPGQSE